MLEKHFSNKPVICNLTLSQRTDADYRRLGYERSVQAYTLTDEAR